METSRRVEKTFIEAGPDHRPAALLLAGRGRINHGSERWNLSGKSIIGPESLKKNERAAGRHQDSRISKNRE